MWLIFLSGIVFLAGWDTCWWSVFIHYMIAAFWWVPVCIVSVPYTLISHHVSSHVSMCRFGCLVSDLYFFAVWIFFIACWWRSLDLWNIVCELFLQNMLYISPVSKLKTAGREYSGFGWFCTNVCVSGWYADTPASTANTTLAVLPIFSV